MSKTNANVRTFSIFLHFLVFLYFLYFFLAAFYIIPDQVSKIDSRKAFVKLYSSEYAAPV